MSILEKFRLNKSSIPKNASFRITQEGKEKLQDYRGDAKSRILVALDTDGTSSVSEIAASSGLSKGAVERIIPSLMRNNFIQLSGSMNAD